MRLATALPTEAEAAEHGVCCRTQEEHQAMAVARQVWQEEQSRVCEAAREIEKTMVWRDIMEPCSAFVGQWHSYYHSYRWQPLRGRYRALGGARAALALIYHMAAATHSEDGIEGEGI